MNWTLIVASICTLLMLFMVWQEYHRPNRSQLFWRIFATMLAVAALACIILPVSYNTQIKTGFNDGVLLTQGFDKNSLSKYQSSKLFTADIGIQKANPKLKINLIADLADIPKGKLAVANLHVLGYGLSGDDLKALKKSPIQFHPPTAPSGIVTIDWTRHIKAGEPLQIQGTSRWKIAKTRLILKGLSTTLDSVIINANADFQLQTKPKNTGRATYTLLVINGTDTLERETIPFEVEPKQILKVLMLATSPDFENRFLKNWLAQHGYGVSVRTAISKDKFSREYFNMPQVSVDHISSNLLDKFDLVIGDLSAFKSLNAAENNTLQQAIQNGLGVIAKADSSKGTSFLSNIFSIEKLSGNEPKASSLLISGQASPTAKLLIDALYIKPQANTQPLVIDDQNHTIANSAIYGSGKIIFSTLNNTYNWALSGNQNDYTALWVGLIDKASRKGVVNQKWSVQPTLPTVDEPATLTVDGPSALPVQIKAEKSNLAFKQNPLLPFSWDATYWPANYGWQQVTQNGIPVYSWYAFTPSDWQPAHATEKIKATQRYASQNNAKTNPDSTQTNILISVSKIYFYLLLLLCLTYLWIERKLS